MGKHMSITAVHKLIMPAVQANTGEDWDVERNQGNVCNPPTSLSWQERE